MAYEVYPVSQLNTRLPTLPELKPYYNETTKEEPHLKAQQHVITQRGQKILDLLPYTSAMPWPFKGKKASDVDTMPIMLEFVGILPDGQPGAIHVAPIELYLDVTLAYESPHPESDPILINMGDIVTTNNERKFSRDLPTLEMTAEDENQLEVRVNKVVDFMGLKPSRREMIKQFPLLLHRREPITWIRLWFRSIERYKNAYEAFHREGHLVTANDDQNQSNVIYRILREHDLSHGGWLRAKHVEIKFDRGCWTAHVNIENLSLLSEEEYPTDPRLNQFYRRPASLQMGWDTETYSPVRTGEPPKPVDNGFELYMDAMAFCWGYASPMDKHPLMVMLLLNPNGGPERLLRRALVDEDNEEKRKWLTEDAATFNRIQIYLCSTQRELIEAKMQLINLLRPSVRVGYNDGGYDSIVLKEWCARHEPTRSTNSHKKAVDYLPKSRFDYPRFERESIKIEAGTSRELAFLHVPGSLAIDMMPVYMKEEDYKKAESHSLDNMLKCERLPVKLDVPASRQFQIWAAVREGHDTVRMSTIMDNNADRPAEGKFDPSTRELHHEPTRQDTAQYTVLYDTSEQLHRLIRYCFVDALSAWRLFAKRSYEINFREDAAGAFMTLKAAAFRGGGVKVGNVVLHAAARMSPPIACPANLHQNRPLGAKYEGGMVLEPMSNIYSVNGVFGLDFASLYPSNYIATGASGERVELRPDAIEKLRADGYSLIDIDFKMMDTGQCISGVIVRARPGKSTDYEKNPEERSLFADILYRLKSGRLIWKKKMGQAKKALEARDDKGSPEYVDLEYQVRLLDAKQKSLKVRMNTFYGVTGQTIGWIYLRPLAGFIPQMGRMALMTAATVLTDELKCTVVYGDTDSTYVRLHTSEYEDIVEPLADDPIEKKKEYLSALVRRTFERVPAIRDHVNKRLSEKFGTRALEMAYEEVLLPCLLTVLKKIYGGYEHIGRPSFDPPHLFLRGLDIQKRGMPEIIRQYGKGMLEALFNVDNVGRKISAQEIVVKYIRDFFTREWAPIHFEKSDTYRPHKQNIRVLKFADRMRQRQAGERAENERREKKGLPPIQVTPMPTPGIRFQYVLVEPEETYSPTGCILKPSIGDLMEYTWVAARQKRRINLWKYMDPQMIRFAAQLCAHELRTDVEGADQLRSRMVITQYEESREEFQAADLDPSGDDSDDEDDNASVSSKQSSRSSAVTKSHAQVLLKQMKLKLHPVFEEIAGVNFEERRRRGRELQSEYRLQKKLQKIEHQQELEARLGHAWQLHPGEDTTTSARVDHARGFAASLVDKEMKNIKKWAGQLAEEERKYLGARMYRFHVARYNGTKRRPGDGIREHTLRWIKERIRTTEDEIRAAAHTTEDEFALGAWESTCRLAALQMMQTRYEMFLEIARDGEFADKKRMPPTVVNDLREAAREDLFKEF